MLGASTKEIIVCQYWA